MKEIYILFWLYSILGWIMETTNVSIRSKKFVNRGFFLGPYCPIYGTGGVLLLALNNYKNDPMVVFILSIFICSLVEYLTSYFIELIYKVRFWDYTGRFFNINGRICLFNAVCFGLMGMLMVCFLNPFFVSVIENIPDFLINIIIVFIFLITIIDMIVTFTTMFDIRKMVVEIKDKTLTNIFKPNTDNTEEVSKKVRSILKEKSFTHKHLSNAYSNLKVYKNNFFKKSEELLKYRKNEKIENTFVIAAIIGVIIGLILGKLFDNTKLFLVICFTLSILVVHVINGVNNGK